MRNRTWVSSPVEPRQTCQGSTGKVAPRHAGNEQLQACRRCQDHRGPQVGLLEHQQGRHGQHKHIRQVGMGKTVDPFLIERQITSHIEYQGILGKLRGLYRQRAEYQPPMRASDLLPKRVAAPGQGL